MRTFSKLATSFWTDDFGRELRIGGPQLQVLALYLTSNRHSTYTGIYVLPKMYIAADLGIDMNSVDAMLRKLDEMNYARYDESTEVLWVIDAARDQLGKSLKRADKMVKAVQRELSELPKKCVLTAQFIERYADAYHLREEEEGKDAAPAKRTATAKIETAAQRELPPADAWARLDVPAAIDLFIALRNAQKATRNKLRLTDTRIAEVIVQMQELGGRGGTISALYQAAAAGDYDLLNLPDVFKPIYYDI
jgi:hypothetical protein